MAWRMIGSAMRASSPSDSLSCGTSRQPSTCSPRFAACASKIACAASASSSACGRKVIATAQFADGLPCSAPSASSSSHGTAVSTPAPSPDTPSPPHPPRCSMQPRAVSVRAMVSWRRRPLRSAMKPTPHASRSSTSASGSGSAGCVPIRPVGTGRTGVETDSASAAQFTHEAWRAATGVRRSELRVGNLTASENPRRESVRAATAAVLLWPMATFAGSSLCEVEMPIELARELEVARARDACEKWRKEPR